MVWLAAALFCVCGIGGVWMYFSRSLAEKNTRIQVLETELEVCRSSAESERKMYAENASQQIELLRSNHADTLEAQRVALEKEYSVKLEAASKTAGMIRENSEKEIRFLKETHQTAIAAEKENTRKLIEQQEQAWKVKIDLMKEEFKTLSDKIFSEKSDLFKKENNQQLGDILNPLRERLVEFKQAVDASREKGVEQSAKLGEQIQKMMDEAKRIGTEAGSLAAALKGEQKTQGNWGEMILEDILARSGLIADVHYDSQKNLRDQDGNNLVSDENKKLRPDVVVHYPDGKDIIIDSKVSLVAHVDYMNAETEEEKKEAAARHVRSVKNHVDELAKKKYADYLENCGRETVDFVIMFIPGESPYQLAMIADPGLWRAAFERKVMIVSPVNLMALLQLIFIAWTKADQDRNQQEILKTASQMLDRLYAFYKDFDDIGKHLDQVQKCYDSAGKRLKQEEGGRSIVYSGEKLRRLGVKFTKAHKLPQRLELDDQAELALPEEVQIPEE